MNRPTSGVHRRPWTQKDAGPVLEELFLPGVEDGGLQVVLFAHGGDGGLVQEMFAEDGELLGPGEVAALSRHGRILHMAPSVCLASTGRFSNSD